MTEPQLVIRPALTWAELPPHEYREVGGRDRCRRCGMMPTTPLDYQVPCI